jgi:hypothetical protein
MAEKKQKQAQVSGFYQTDDQVVTVHVPVIFFKEEGTTIAYCPALNVYGYGNDEEQAEESFKIALGEFFRYSLNKKTLIPELEALGWEVKRKKKFIPPVFSTLLDKNPEFKTIFDTRNFTKFETGISIPIPA